jgi:hypothetical protein
MNCDQLQSWADENGVKGIRFYPSNPSESSAEGILNSALNAIKAFESGRSTNFEDCIKLEASHQ